MEELEKIKEVLVSDEAAIVRILFIICFIFVLLVWAIVIVRADKLKIVLQFIRSFFSKK